MKKSEERKEVGQSVEKKKKKKKEETEEMEKGPKINEMEEDIEKDSKYSAKVECIRLYIRLTQGKDRAR